jgi:hypothetical protein
MNIKTQAAMEDSASHACLHYNNESHSNSPSSRNNVTRAQVE